MIEKIIQSRKFPPVLLLFGEEELLVYEAATAVFDAARLQDEAGMSTDVLDGEGMTLDAIISLARSFPMMSERRTVWIRRFDKVSASKQKSNVMTSYMAQPMESTVLIFTASIPTAAGIGAQVSKNAATAQRKIKGLKYPFDVLLQTATWLEFPAMKSSQVVSWLQKRAGHYNTSISSQLCEYLVAKHGTSLRELDLELEKLATFVGDRAEITEDDIVTVVGGTRAYSVFELQRAIGQANLASASTILDGMLNNDRQELLIIAMLTHYFTTLFKLIDAKSLGSSNAIASVVGLPPFAVGDHLDALQRIGPRQVEIALHELRRAESLIKSSSADPRSLLQTVLLSIIPSTSKEQPASLKAFSW